MVCFSCHDLHADISVSHYHCHLQNQNCEDHLNFLWQICLPIVVSTKSFIISRVASYEGNVFFIITLLLALPISFHSLQIIMNFPQLPKLVFWATKIIRNKIEVYVIISSEIATKLIRNKILKLLDVRFDHSNGFHVI